MNAARAGRWSAAAAGAIALASLAVVPWLADRSVRTARRDLLLDETAFAASALARPAGDATLARTFPGRWARSTLVRPDVGRPVLSDEDGALVGRAAIRSAPAAAIEGTLVLLERRDAPRHLPKEIDWAVAMGAAVLLLVSATIPTRFQGTRRWLLAAIVVVALVVPAVMAGRWVRDTLATFQGHRQALGLDATATAVPHDLATVIVAVPTAGAALWIALALRARRS